MSSAHSVTQLLEQWNHGDREALDKLMPLIYEADNFQNRFNGLPSTQPMFEP